MTEKQKRFCEEYLKTSGNGTQAYMNVYKTKNEKTARVNASKILTNTSIKNYINELSEKVENDAIADIQEIQEKLTSIIRGTITEQVIVTSLVGDGKSEAKVIEKKPSIKDMIKACEILGRMLGAFNDKIIIDGAVPVVISGGEDLAE